jgi:transketolase
MQNIRELQKTAIQIRKQLVQLIYDGKGGHIGGSLSSVDILVALYFHEMKIDPSRPNWENRDKFILSKGHSVESYYSVLAEACFFPKEVLKSYGKFQSILAGHPTTKVPGIELNSGALGHGLSVGVGMALAAKRDAKENRIFVLMGDGEQGEGSIMEASNAGGHYKLDNLTAIIDRNRLQISGNTEDVMSLDSLKNRWLAYNWDVIQVDGNDMQQLIAAFDRNKSVKGKPHMIIANTTKGKGISFIENRAEWHHKVPTSEQLQLAMDELNKKLEELQ